MYFVLNRPLDVTPISPHWPPFLFSSGERDCSDISTWRDYLRHLSRRLDLSTTGFSVWFFLLT